MPLSGARLIRIANMHQCKCAYCSNEKGFEFPRELLERLATGNVVVFAGAGISTENRMYCRTTFYEEIKYELSEQKELDFPSLMSVYCKQPDGRIKLIQKKKIGSIISLHFVDSTFR